MEQKENNSVHEQMDKLYDECISYLEKENAQKGIGMSSLEDTNYERIEEKNEKNNNHREITRNSLEDPNYDKIEEKTESIVEESKSQFKVENEKSRGSIDSVLSEGRSERLRKLSQQLPKIIITQSNTSLDMKRSELYKFIPALPAVDHSYLNDLNSSKTDTNHLKVNQGNYNSGIRLNHLGIETKRTNLPKNGLSQPHRMKRGYASEYPKRLVSKNGMENVAVISNVPFENIRLLNDTFHTLINLRWRWIVIGTIVVHFAIWLVFAVFWYITALAHYDFEPDPPKKTCVTGGKDFVTIFLASVEAQTTIGFGDRAIDEECPESIFLFVMQLILGTGLSGVLTCVVYAKLTRPEKLSRDGVGFSKKAAICMRDGKLCLMMRAWDLNYDHIISSEFTAHFINTYRTREGEVVRYYARCLALRQRQFLLWPVTLVHVIDANSPLYEYTPELISGNNYEITVSLKGASASMGTFTQSQTSYLPKEVAWGYRFPPVVKYNCRKQKYVIDQRKLNLLEPVDTPYCCAKELYESSAPIKRESPRSPGTPTSFSEKVASFQLERSSSFRHKL